MQLGLRIQYNLLIHSTGCAALTTISHVSHIARSVDILKEGIVKSGLVYDESKLRRERILVTWLSPNDWKLGFMYGNVRFSFDWKRLLSRMGAYWIEKMDYKPPAARILLTDENYKNRFQVYRATDGHGPWWYDKSNGEHYWNGTKTLEIMIEADLYIENSLKVDFVNHHDELCKIGRVACPDLGLSKDEARSLFLALVVGRSVGPKILGWVDNGEAGEELRRAFRELLVDLENHSEGVPYYDGLDSQSLEASATTRSILRFLGERQNADVKTMLGLFGSLNEVKLSCAKEVARSFGLSGWKSLKP